MSTNLLPASIEQIGWVASFVINGLILILLGWILFIRRMRRITEQRRQVMAEVWRPLLVSSLIEPPAILPPIDRRDHVQFLYLWNHFQESIKGESSEGLCRLLTHTHMDAVARSFLLKGTMRQQLLALVTIGHMKDRSVWTRLVELAHAHNAFLSLEAARALVRIDASSAIPILVPLISHRSDWSPLKILGILQGVNDLLVAEGLGKAAQDAPPLIASRLIRFLASTRCQRALPFIRPLVQRRPLDEDVLASCLSLFGQCMAPRDLPIVRDCLTHPTWFIRVQAATALGKMGVEDDEAALIALLRDSHWWVRYRAAEALSVLPSMTDDKLAMLVQVLPSSIARKALTPFVAKRIEQALAQEPPAAA